MFKVVNFNVVEFGKFEKMWGFEFLPPITSSDDSAVGAALLCLVISDPIHKKNPLMQ